jgi:hypothetical protein
MTKESFSIHGENLLKKIKELIEEGNIRKITITDKSGRELMSFPLTFGVVGVLVAPVLAAIGAIAALVGECTITVEREEPEKQE